MVMLVKKGKPANLFLEINVLIAVMIAFICSWKINLCERTPCTKRICTC